jgi:hypothetical protein
MYHLPDNDFIYGLYLPEESEFKTAHYRERIGIDTLTITPQPDNGNTYLPYSLNITVNSRYISAKGRLRDPQGSLKGMFSTFHKGTGGSRRSTWIRVPDFTSEVIRYLDLGQETYFSMVDRHESILGHCLPIKRY